MSAKLTTRLNGLWVVTIKLFAVVRVLIHCSPAVGAKVSVRELVGYADHGALKRPDQKVVIYEGFQQAFYGVPDTEAVPPVRPDKEGGINFLHTPYSPPLKWSNAQYDKVDQKALAGKTLAEAISDRHSQQFISEKTTGALFIRDNLPLLKSSTWMMNWNLKSADIHPYTVTEALKMLTEYGLRGDFNWILKRAGNQTIWVTQHGKTVRDLVSAIVQAASEAGLVHSFYVQPIYSDQPNLMGQDSPEQIKKIMGFQILGL